MHPKYNPRKHNKPLQNNPKYNQQDNSSFRQLISPTKISYHKLDKYQPQHRMPTRTPKLAITRPLQHLDISCINPIRPSLLNKRFHKRKKNRQKNKPYQKHKYLKSPMRYQIKSHNISSTYNRIKQI